MEKSIKFQRLKKKNNQSSSMTISDEEISEPTSEELQNIDDLLVKYEGIGIKTLINEYLK